MASPSHKINVCYYSVLGLARSASPSAIRTAYKKLAMIWHPDKCRNEDLAAGAKLKFQEIQEAYTVLSDIRKKVLYDSGLYDPNDDEEDIEGLSSLMNEISGTIAKMKAAEKNGGNVNSFEEFQQLFVNIFNTDYRMAHSSLPATYFRYPTTHFSYPATHFSYPTVHPEMANSNNKRDRQLHEGSLPFNIPGNEYLYDYCDSFDMSNASTSTPKRKKRRAEQEEPRVCS